MAFLIGTETDARKWAQEFVKMHGGDNEGLMAVWFAGAIEAGRDAGRKTGAQEPEKFAELRQDYVSGRRPSKLSPDGMHVTGKLIMEWQQQFIKKAADYNDDDGFEPHRVLGVKGQFAEIFRKVWKLKNALWDGRTLQYEGEREILMDLIGHCFLTIAMLDESKGGKRDA